jgi:hypothetical protein
MLSSLGWSKPFSMPKAAGMQLLLRIRNSPDALALGDARTSDNDSLCRACVSIEESGDLSNDQRNKSETGRLEQLPKSKTKISHHMHSNITMRQFAQLDSIQQTPLTCVFV